MNAPDDPRQRRAWREPMVWLVALIPTAAVIATVAMVVVAGGPGSVDVVADPVRHTAQVQVADLGPDARARQAGMSAVVRVLAPRGGEAVIEVLPVSGRFRRDATLTLALHHPALADRDRTLVLQPQGAGWRTRATPDSSHDWNVQLGPADGAWRLQGRWPARQQAAYLRPALPAR